MTKLAAYPLLRCLALYRQTPWRFWFTALLYAVVGLSLAWQQSLIGRAVDDVERGVAVTRAADGTLDASVAWHWFVVLGSVALGRAVLSYGVGIQALVIQQRLLSTLREMIFSKVQQLDLAYHWQHGAGEMVTRTTRDSDKVRDALTSFWRQVVESLVIVIAAMGLLFWYHPGLGIVPLMLTCAGFVILMRQTGRLVEMDRAVGAAYDVVNQDLAEGIHGVRVIKAFALESTRIDRFQAQVKGFVDEAIAALAYSSSRVPLPQIVVACGQVWVLAFGVYLVVHDRLSYGELVAALLMGNALVFRIENIGRITKIFADARSSAARIWELLDAKVAIKSGCRSLPPGSLGVRLDEVSVLPPGGGNPMLDRCSLQIDPGEIVALVGNTGAGKSTLAGLLPRLADPNAGDVSVGSRDAGWISLRELKLEELRRRVQVVPQEAFLFSDTLAANLRLAAPEASDDQLVEALRLAAAEELLSVLPEGLQTRLGDRGVTLSGGQRQRLCLARALLAEPAVLVLDDSTSALDAITERKILDNIRARHYTGGERTTVLIVASKLSSILLADRVMLLADGRIVEQGTHARLSTQSAAYRSLLGLDDGH